MGKTHAEALRRLGHVDIAAIASSTMELAADFGRLMDVDYLTDDYKKILADKTIEAVHILVPNSLHFQLAKDSMEAGKAVVCEKPLTVTAAEAQELVEVAERTGVQNAVEHNLRFYPAVQHVRHLIASGDLGEILHVQGTYSQDWLLYDTDFNWRVVSGLNGPLRAMGDIGSHWFDMITHVTGLDVTELCADLATFHEFRKEPKVRVDTFDGKTLAPEDYNPIPVDTDDFGMVMLKMGARARGCFTVSQVAAGRKNSLRWEIFGTKCSAAWDQERPDELWIGNRNTPNLTLIKDPSQFRGGIADYPGGHVEGYPDTHKQLLKRFYRRMVNPAMDIEYPTFKDGLKVMRLLEKVWESHTTRTWVTV